MNLSNYIKGVQKELRLSTFPTQNVVINFTLFVIGFTAVMAAFLGLLDLVFGTTTVSFINTLKGNAGAVSNVVDTATNTINAVVPTATTSPIVK